MLLLYFHFFICNLGISMGILKLKGTKKKNELVRLPYRFKFEKQFKGLAKNGWR